MSPKAAERIIPIAGGDFYGPQIRATVLPGGADWQVLRHDGVAELEARYTLRCDDGALIYVRNHGLRHGPPEIMAALAAGRSVNPRPTISAARHSLDQRGAIRLDDQAIIVCSGEREPAAVKLKFYWLL